MPFSVQYLRATGEITATVNSRPNDADLPEGYAQLVFDDWQDTNNKAVNLETLSLVDAPPPPEE